MNGSTGIAVLDPTVAPLPADGVVADRPTTLDGVTIGLLANGKMNSVEMLTALHDVLADRYDFGGVVERNKMNASRPCPEDIIDEMVAKCDVVITSSGD
ncbi:MAG: hypothetical protein F4X94_03570 [Dehalococcoidia bacterium]|nr:hypothetical protein [Dehalococcoidia bacterium]